MSKTNSQLITAFIETKQNMELNEDKKRYSEFEETIKTRAKKVKAEAGKEETSVNQAVQLASPPNRQWPDWNAMALTS
jgi:hypothetical protein